MASKECIAMILAGGQGSRLGVLTKKIAKPAVPYGAKYRLIDFPLSNCIHSGVDTVGVLTQYQPLELNTYIGNGQPWDLDRNNGGVYVLPPYVDTETTRWYKGTANAIYQNIDFIDQFDPRYVLILGGDHIYKMDYSKMLRFQKAKDADATIAVIDVPLDEASRLGIMTADEKGRITKFTEKPKNPDSTLASMGIYIFKWKALREYLINDERDETSSNDFGKNIIPKMLKDGQKLYTYRFDGYWKDVGTLLSFWQANMDLLEERPQLDLYDSNWTVFSRNPVKPPHIIGTGGKVRNSFVTEGCNIFGTVNRSIIFEGAQIGKGCEIVDSIIMANVAIGDNTKVCKSIIADRAEIGKNVQIGLRHLPDDEHVSDICSGDLVLVGSRVKISDNSVVGKNAMISGDI